MSKKYFIVFGLFLVVSFLFLNIVSVKAETWTWTGSGDGQTWTDPKNWGLGATQSSLTSYPGATTTPDVIIGATAAVPAGPTVYATTTLAYGVNTLTLGDANVGPNLYIGGANFGASSTISVLATSTLTLATSTYGSGILNLGQTTTGAPLRLISTTAVASFTAATGTVAYIGGGTATIYVATTTFYNLTLAATTTSATAAIRTYTFGAFTAAQRPQIATTTVSNIFYVATSSKADFQGVADLLLSGSGTPFSKTYGNFMQSSKIVYSSTSATNIATGTYANLELTGGSSVVKTLLGNTTATSTVKIPSSSTLAIITYTFTATGATWTNSGTVTEGTGGKITHASSGAGFFSDSACSSAATSYSADSLPIVYVGFTDTSLNLLASTAEATQSATITSTSGITDSESVTLTETGAATGLFCGGLSFQLSGSNVSGKLDYQGGGTLALSYTDSQDTTDTGSASASFTGTTPGGGGGSSGGGTVTVAATPAVSATPATPATPTVTPATPAVPATPATPATPAAPTLDSIQTKIASAVAKVSALTKDSPAADVAAVQAKIADILKDIQALQSTPASQGVALGFNFAKSLALGTRNDDVKNLQEALKTDSSIYPEGRVTGYFGPATLKAVQKFQEKYGIASSGQVGYGVVGPKTRAKLNELFGSH